MAEKPAARASEACPRSVTHASPAFARGNLREPKRTPGRPASQGRRERGKGKDRVERRMPDSSSEPLPGGRKTPWPQPGQDHTLGHTSWTVGLDRLQPPALGAASQPSLHPLEHTCTLVHHLPKCKQGWREMSQHLTLGQKGGMQHSQLDGGDSQMHTKGRDSASLYPATE